MASPRGHGPLISVIVPTRDRPNALDHCLRALDAQTVADRLEIVVVDDGSSAADAVRAVVGRCGRARLIRLEGAGPAAARNAGAAAAQGSLLCFTDDDCVPDADWAERLTEALERGAHAVAGVTIPTAGALAEASELVARAPAAAGPDDGDMVVFAPSNNLAATRRILETLPFDATYPSAAGEDREWCARLRAAGHELRLERGARVVHAQRLTPAAFLRQQFRYGEGAYRFRRRSGELRPLEPAGFYAALVRRGFGRSFAIGLLVLIAQVAAAAGFVVAAGAAGASRWRVNASTAAAPADSREDEQRPQAEPPRLT